MKKLNNKGYLTIEIILAATIAFTIAFFLMELTINFSNASDNYYVDTIFITDKSLISNNIKKYIEKNIADNGIITNVSCNGNTCTFTFLEGATKQLAYNQNNKTITYDTYSKEVKNVTLNSMSVFGSIEEDKYIRILLSFKNDFTNSNYDINIIIKNSDSAENINLVEHINTLYNGAAKTVVTANAESECASTDQSGYCTAWNATKTVNYNYATSVNLMNDRLGGTTSSLDGGNIRYYGKTPNNYIDIGDRTSDNQIILWRIIGLFDGKIRIMRNDTIGCYSWDTSPSDVNQGNGINEWSQADLMKLLNPSTRYTPSGDVGESLWWNNQSGYCYDGSDNRTTSCDFRSIGLTEKVHNIVDVQTLYLGGLAFEDRNKYANQVYNIERKENSPITFNDSIVRTSIWQGEVGIPYMSDYGYASDLGVCKDIIDKYNSTNCRNSNWIRDKSIWIISPQTDDRLVFYGAIRVEDGGGTGYVGSYFTNARYGYGSVRPTLMLKSNVLIKPRGDGSINKPYTVVYE